MSITSRLRRSVTPFALSVPNHRAYLGAIEADVPQGTVVEAGKLLLGDAPGPVRDDPSAEVDTEVRSTGYGPLEQAGCAWNVGCDGRSGAEGGIKSIGSWLHGPLREE
jgi:hypothetical protein